MLFTGKYPEKVNKKSNRINQDHQGQSPQALRYSIVIATMNRCDSLQATLESVAVQTFLPDELIVVDQSTNEETKMMCAAYSRKIRSRGQVVKYIYQSEGNLVKARNRGVAQSTGDVVCFIDDDVIVYRDYFEKVAAYFQDPSVGGVSGNVVVHNEPRGIKWELRKILTRLFLINSYQGKLTPSTFGYPIHEWEIDRPREVELFAGYSMNYRRELVVRHPCDERLSGYSFREDVDLSYRISREAKLIIVPDARFIHNLSKLNRLDIQNLKKMHFKNYYYLFNKFKKFGIFSAFLFYYSLTGIVFIDFLEFLCSFDERKYQLFRSNFAAIKGMRGK